MCNKVNINRYSGDRDNILREPLIIGIYHKPMREWLDKYDNRVGECSLSTNEQIDNILKNYMLDEAISAANRGDFSIVDQLFHIAQTSYDEHIEFERWSKTTPPTKRYRNQKLSYSS